MQPVINNDELEKVNSKLIFMEKNSQPKFGYNDKSPINNYETGFSQPNDYTSSYYAFTNKLYDREEGNNELPATSKISSTYDDKGDQKP